MVSVSGVRGRVGAPLTPELVSALAAAFGAFVRLESGHRPVDGPVYVGRDSRTSGPMFVRAVAAGLQSVGVPVIDLGMVPTPTLVLAVGRSGAIGGISVTASHNGAEWNALKLVSAEGVFLDADLSARFRTSLNEQDPERAAWDAIPSVTEDSEAWPRHLEAILALPHIDVPVLRARNMRVAIDCVHGAGGPVMIDLLEALGCSVEGIGMKPDGFFPRDPEPTAANLGDLGALVRDSGAEIGLAVDPDVDRLALVDETGGAMGEDLTLALAAATVLGRTPGPVVTNLSTSQVVEDVARAYGVPLARAPVGEVNVARRMQAENAVVGGEGNGGVILPALHHTRDAPLAAALVLQHIVDEGVSASVAVARWPSYAIVKVKVSFPREALELVFDAMEQDFGAEAVDRTDGLRLTWPARGAWLHVRPSGTEPVVRLIAEAREEEAAHALTDRAARLLDGIA